MVKEIGRHYLDYGQTEFFGRCKHLGMKLLAESMTLEDQITQDRI